MTAGLHARAKAVFGRALDVPPGARPAFLAEACEGDDELAREVASLLEHHREATLLVPPGAPVSGAVGAHTRPARPALRRSGLQRFWAALVRRDRRPQRVALAGLVLLVALALVLSERIRTSLEGSVTAQLETLRDMCVRDIERWMQREGDSVRRWAEAPDVRARVLALAQARAAGAPSDAGLLDALRQDLAVVIDTYKDGLFAVLDDGGRLLAWSDPGQLSLDPGAAPDFAALRISAQAYAAFDAALHGSVVLLTPYTSGTMVDDFPPVHDEPRMAALAPVRDGDGRVVAVLAFAFDAGTAFTEVLAGGRVGRSGETYAVDADGRMLSGSRFDEQLWGQGRLPPEQPAMLHLRVTTPTPAGVGAGAPAELTRAAGSVTAGRADVAVESYTGYRGAPVVGAWQWLPARGFGVITELGEDEAYGPMAPIRRFAWLLFTVLGAAVLLVVVSAWSQSRMQRTIAELGQYQLDELIGRGGMGAVYRAHHAMLRRPTAVKLLEPDAMDADAIRRFEREVQRTSELTHPNTVEVYDFGRTEDGLFYYAMEYLPGPSLEQLVAQEGALPVRRAVHLVDQVCASLEEAHAHGLIHRDVKPGNVIVCERGGRHDVAKLLDFGLVTSIAPDGDGDATLSGPILGTPLYMAPERLRSPREVDGRSDLYSVGALLFKLVTGGDVFRGGSQIAMLAQVLEDTAPRLAARASVAVPARLDALVASCLEKDPDARPPDAGAVRLVLAEVADELGAWTESDARAAWSRGGST